MADETKTTETTTTATTTEAKPAETTTAPAERTTMLGDAARTEPKPGEVAKTAEVKKEGEADPAKKGAAEDLYGKNEDGSEKTAEQKAEIDKAKAKEEADKEKAKGAPEKYEDFKLPEGVTLAPESLAGFAAIAKESNLSQAQAQKFIDMASEHTKAVLTQAGGAQVAAWNAVRDKWVAEVEADPEFGGTNFDKSKLHAYRAVTAYGGTKAERDRLINEVLDKGFGDHPLLFKLMARMGATVSDDIFVEGGKQPTAAEQTAAQKLYGKK